MGALPSKDVDVKQKELVSQIVDLEKHPERWINVYDAVVSTCPSDYHVRCKNKKVMPVTLSIMAQQLKDKSPSLHVLLEACRRFFTSKNLVRTLKGQSLRPLLECTKHRDIRVAHRAISCLGMLVHHVYESKELDAVEAEVKHVVWESVTFPALWDLIERVGVVCRDGKNRESVQMMHELLCMVRSILVDRVATTSADAYVDMITCVHKSVNALLALSVHRASVVAVPACQILRELFLGSSVSAMHQLQRTVRTRGTFLHHLAIAVDVHAPPDSVHVSVCRALVGAYCDDDRQAVALLARVLPPVLLLGLYEPGCDAPLEELSNSVWKTLPRVKREEMEKAARFQRVRRGRWGRVFEQFATDSEEPVLIWNGLTRGELVERLHEEIRDLHYQSRVSLSISGREEAWAWEGFDVTYATLRKEVKVGPYFLRLTVPLLENSASGFAIADPREWLSQLYEACVVEDNVLVKRDILRAIRVLLQVNFAEIGGERVPLRYLLWLLTPRQLVEEHVNEVVGILNLACGYAENVKRLVDADGISRLCHVLGLFHGLPEHTPQSMELFHDILSLFYTIASVPRLRKRLCQPPALNYIVQAILCGDDTTTAKILGIVEKLCQRNPRLTHDLHLTGIFLFTVHTLRNNHACTPDVALFWHTYHMKQSLDKAKLTDSGGKKHARSASTASAGSGAASPPPPSSPTGSSSGAGQQSVLSLYFPTTMVRILQVDGPRAFADAVTSTIERPDCLWDGEQLAHLQHSVEEQLAPFLLTLQTRPTAVWAPERDTAVSYDSLDAELCVGDVYIRRFVKQPVHVVPDPQYLCEQCVLHVQRDDVPTDDIKACVDTLNIALRRFPREFHAAVSDFTGLLPLMQRDDHDTREGAELLVAVLRLLLGAVHGGSYEPILSRAVQRGTVRILLHIVRRVPKRHRMDAGTAELAVEAAELALQVVRYLCKVAVCLDQLAEQHVCHVLAPVLRASSAPTHPALATVALMCVHCFVASQVLQQHFLESGCVVQVLLLALGSPNGDTKVREAAAATLHTLVNATVVHPGLTALLTTLLTPGVFNLLVSSASEFVHCIDGTSYTALVVWGPVHRKALHEKLLAVIDELPRHGDAGGEEAADEATPPVHVWDYAACKVEYPHEPMIADVYLKPYCRQPRVAVDTNALMDTLVAFVGDYASAQDAHGVDMAVHVVRALHTIIHTFSKMRESCGKRHRGLVKTLAALLPLGRVALALPTMALINDLVHDDELVDCVRPVHRAVLECAEPTYALVGEAMHLLANVARRSSRAAGVVVSDGAVVTAMWVLLVSDALHSAASGGSGSDESDGGDGDANTPMYARLAASKMLAVLALDMENGAQNKTTILAFLSPAHRNALCSSLRDPSALVGTIDADTESAVMLWNGDCRADAVAFVAEERADLPLDDGSAWDAVAVAARAVDAHRTLNKELCVDVADGVHVFVRLFVQSDTVDESIDRAVLLHRLSDNLRKMHALYRDTPSDTLAHHMALMWAAVHHVLRTTPRLYVGNRRVYDDLSIMWAACEPVVPSEVHEHVLDVVQLLSKEEQFGAVVAHVPTMHLLLVLYNVDGALLLTALNDLVRRAPATLARHARLAGVVVLCLHSLAAGVEAARKAACVLLHRLAAVPAESAAVSDIVCRVLTPRFAKPLVQSADALRTCYDTDHEIDGEMVWTRGARGDVPGKLELIVRDACAGGAWDGEEPRAVFSTPTPTPTE